MALPAAYRLDDSAVARALDVVGERWTLLIVGQLFFGQRRYSDIRRRLGISPAVLTQRLGGLVEEGIVARVPGAGAHDEYELTEKGASLWPVVAGLAEFGNEYCIDPKYRQHFAHHQCGTTLDGAGFCERCRIVPTARDVDRLPLPADLEPSTSPAHETEPRRLLG